MLLSLVYFVIVFHLREVIKILQNVRGLQSLLLKQEGGGGGCCYRSGK